MAGAVYYHAGVSPRSCFPFSPACPKSRFAIKTAVRRCPLRSLRSRVAQNSQCRLPALFWLPICRRRQPRDARQEGRSAGVESKCTGPEGSKARAEMKMANKPKRLAPNQMGHAGTVIDVAYEATGYVARINESRGKTHDVMALCHMARPLLETIAGLMNEGGSPQRIPAYGKLKALAVLAGRLWQKKSWMDFLHHWKVFHGLCGESPYTPGFWQCFEVEVAGDVYSVTYKPIFFDTLDQFEISRVGSAASDGGRRSTHLVRRAELIQAGDLREWARRQIDEMAGEGVQCVLELDRVGEVAHAGLA